MPSAINAFAGIPGSEVPEVKNDSAFAPSPVGPSGKADPELLDLLGRRQRLLAAQARRLQGAGLPDQRDGDAGFCRTRRLALHDLSLDHARSGADRPLAEADARRDRSLVQRRRSALLPVFPRTDRVHGPYRDGGFRGDRRHRSRSTRRSKTCRPGRASAWNALATTSNAAAVRSEPGMRPGSLSRGAQRSC